MRMAFRSARAAETHASVIARHHFHALIHQQRGSPARPLNRHRCCGWRFDYCCAAAAVTSARPTGSGLSVAGPMKPWNAQPPLLCVIMTHDLAIGKGHIRGAASSVGIVVGPRRTPATVVPRAAELRHGARLWPKRKARERTDVGPVVVAARNSRLAKSAERPGA